MAGTMKEYLTRKCRYFSEADIKVCIASYYIDVKMHHMKMSFFSNQLWKYALVAGLAVKMYRAIGSTTNSGSAKGEVEAI